MNKKEFMELQSEVASVIIEYEKLCKKGHLLDLRFNYTFCELLIKEQYLKFENNLLVGICTMLIEKKSMDEVDEFIKNQRMEYSKLVVKHTNKVAYAAQVLKYNSELPKEIVELLATSFEDYVLNYHPAIQFLSYDDEFRFYDALKECYYENNYSKFKELLEQNKKSLIKTEFDDELQIKAARYYYDIMSQINAEARKRKDKYPYNIESVFDDKISIAAFEGELRTKISKISEANQALHKDVIQAFGEDVTL